MKDFISTNLRITLWPLAAALHDHGKLHKPQVMQYSCKNNRSKVRKAGQQRRHLVVRLVPLWPETERVFQALVRIIIALNFDAQLLKYAALRLWEAPFTTMRRWQMSVNIFMYKTLYKPSRIRKIVKRITHLTLLILLFTFESDTAFFLSYLNRRPLN